MTHSIYVSKPGPSEEEDRQQQEEIAAAEKKAAQEKGGKSSCESGCYICQTSCSYAIMELVDARSLWSCDYWIPESICNDHYYKHPL